MSATPALLLAAAALPAAVAGAGPAAHGTAGAGTATSPTGSCRGVVVVVDPGGSAAPAAACVPGDPASGLAALRAAGHRETPVQSFPAAVCRVDGLPATASCRAMPPADSYWSYWRSDGKGGWTYQRTGAADSDPAPGSVEGWALGPGDPPRTAPGRAEASATPAPSSAATSAPAPASPRASASSRSSASSGPAPADGAGSLTGVLAGGGVLLALGGAGAWVARRRRAAADRGADADDGRPPHHGGAT